MNKTCAGPPTRNQVSSASDWFANNRPRSAGILAFRSATMSGKLMRPRRHRVEPSRQHFAAQFARRRPECLRLPAYLARIDAGLAELDGVADQPGFEPRRFGL